MDCPQPNWSDIFHCFVMIKTVIEKEKKPPLITNLSYHSYQLIKKHETVHKFDKINSILQPVPRF